MNICVCIHKHTFKSTYTQIYNLIFKTGPNDDDLKEHIGNTFIQFIRHLQQPVCLVADLVC